MAATEIEKLERRYAENPQGLTFAPLAEVHRKNGEVARALELLRAGLELHPNYIPASIVLGRCHWDLGELPAAEAAFSHVLRLDDENVIALKSLADINERLDRLGDAQRWLNRLISVDRSNEEARQQLTRIEAAKQQSSSAPAVPQEIAAVEAPPKAQPAAEPRATAAAEAKPEPPIQKPEPPIQREVKPESQPATAALDLTAVIAEPATVQPPDPAEKAPEPEASVLEFLDTSQPGGQAAGPGDQASEATLLVPEDTVTPPEEPAPVAGLISQEFVPPKEAAYRSHPELTHEFVSDAALESDQLEVETTEEVELQSSGASEFRVPNAAEDFMEVVAGPPPSPPEPVRPLPAAEPPKRSYSVSETKGQSVAAFFQALLAARPPGSPNSAARAQDRAHPSDSAQDTLTQSPGSQADVASETPAVPASAASQDAGVSFDDFFGATAAGSSPLPNGGADPSEDDLDQFQSWLQNLKR